MTTVLPAVLAMALGLLAFDLLPPGLGALPLLAPGPVLLGAVAGGPRWAVGAWLLGRVLAAAAAGMAAVLPAEPLRVDTLVTGVVSDFPRASAGRLQFVLDVEATAPAVAGIRRVLVTWYDPPAAAPGPAERWQLTLRLRAPHGLVNPGGSDQERWFFAAGIDATGYVRAAAPDAARGPAGGVAAALLRARAALAARIAAAAPDPAAVPWLAGLAVGVYQDLPDAEWELLRRTGTVHLVSVSGFHLTLVALPLALAGAGLAAVLAAGGWPATPRVAGALLALAGATVYGGLAGFSVPTLRSLLTLAAVAACVAGRRGRPLAALLALAAAGALAIDPLGLLTPGFWLSFVGVLGLATAFGGARAPVATGVPARAGRALRDLAAAQVAAGLALLPLTLAWFGQVSVAGSLANLVAIPFFSLAVLPPVLVGAVLAAIAPGLATPVFALATAALAGWRSVLGGFAGLPLALVELPVPGPASLALAAAGVALALWPRPLALRALAPACLLPLFLARPPALPDGAFAVTVLDVGQGLAVLVQTRRHALLYDAGPGWGDGDAGDRTVLPVLRQAGATRLDRFVVSHGDIDHGGGAAAVLARHPGTDLLATQWPWPSPPSRRRPCRAGEAWRWDGVTFTVLHPDGDAGGPDNEQSCVIAVAGPGGGALLTGDIGARSEARLAGAGRLRPTELVIAPHHGSRSSSSAALVDAVRARYVVFTTGYANRWDFPRPDVVARWVAAGACPLTTAETGALRFVATPGTGLRLARAERLAWRPAWRRPGRIAACALRSPGPPVYSGAGLVAP